MQMPTKLPKTAKCPAVFEEQHRAELTAYRAAAAYFKANNITKLPSPKKLEAEYAQLASEKATFYEQYKEAKEELLKLKTAKQKKTVSAVHRFFVHGTTPRALISLILFLPASKKGLFR